MSDEELISHGASAPGGDAADSGADAGGGATGSESAGTEWLARLINGLVEAGDLLMLHVQRIEWDPIAANMARECWLESRAALSGDYRPKRWPEDAPSFLLPAASRAPTPSQPASETPSAPEAPGDEAFTRGGRER